MEKRRTVRSSGTDKFLEYTKAIVTALILALVIRTFIIQAFKIPSGSIDRHPPYRRSSAGEQDHLRHPADIPFTNVTVFHMPGLRTPAKGEVIVFKYPEDPTRDFIKRVVAVEGDTVQMINKKLYVNGKPTNDSFTQHTDTSIHPGQLDPRDNCGPYLIPKNKLFVMGDNRDQSYDSRFWGYVDVQQVLGKAMIIYWSWDSDKSFPRFGRMGMLIH